MENIMKTILACVIAGLFIAITIYLLMPYCTTVTSFIHFIAAAYLTTFALDVVYNDINNLIKKMKKDE